MFNITLQRSDSRPNTLNKTITDIVTLSGTLKEKSSIIDPIIMIEYIGTLSSCNYMTIPTFDRKYFVTDIVQVRTNLIEIHAHCDVLSSRSHVLVGCTGIIKRQENQWNLYLDDGSFKVYNNPMVLTKGFPTGFSTKEFVLAVAGG